MSWRAYWLPPYYSILFYWAETAGFSNCQGYLAQKNSGRRRTTINTYEGWPLGIRGQVWYLMGSTFGGISGAMLGTAMDLIVRGAELGVLFPLVAGANLAGNYRELMLRQTTYD